MPVPSAASPAAGEKGAEMASILQEKIIDAVLPRTGVDMDTFLATLAAANVAENGIRGGRVFLGNAFSLQMISQEGAICSIARCEPGDVPGDAVSVIGHPDTAAVVSGLLGRPVPCNRASISLEEGDVLYVAQLEGGRLPEGANVLPEGFKMTFRKVTVTVTT